MRREARHTVKRDEKTYVLTCDERPVLGSGSARLSMDFKADGLANVPRVSFITLEIVFKSPSIGSGEKLQQLKAFVVLAEELNSGPSTHMVALVTACNSRSGGTSNMHGTHP